METDWEKRRRKGPNTMMIRATGSWNMSKGQRQVAHTNEELPGDMLL
jgi:hypothetical protein